MTCEQIKVVSEECRFRAVGLSNGTLVVVVGPTSLPNRRAGPPGLADGGVRTVQLDYEDVPVVSPTDDRLPRRLIIIISKMRQSMLPFRWLSSLCGGGSPKQLPPPGLPQRVLPPSRLLDSSAPDERRLQLASCDSDLLPSTRAMPRHSFKFQVMSLSVLGQSI